MAIPDRATIFVTSVVALQLHKNKIWPSYICLDGDSGDSIYYAIRASDASVQWVNRDNNQILLDARIPLAHLERSVNDYLVSGYHYTATTSTEYKEAFRRIQTTGKRVKRATHKPVTIPMFEDLEKEEQERVFAQLAGSTSNGASTNGVSTERPSKKMTSEEARLFRKIQQRKKTAEW